MIATLLLACCLSQWSVARLVEPKPDAELFSYYQELNRVWFHHRLPEESVAIYWDLLMTERRGNLAATTVTNYEGEGERIAMYMSPRHRGCDGCVKMDMMHEMAHLDLKYRGSPGWAGHGVAFQRRMLQLARRGAFKDLW